MVMNKFNLDVFFGALGVEAQYVFVMMFCALCFIVYFAKAEATPLSEVHDDEA